MASTHDICKKSPHVGGNHITATLCVLYLGSSDETKLISRLRLIEIGRQIQKAWWALIFTSCLDILGNGISTLLENSLWCIMSTNSLCNDNNIWCLVGCGKWHVCNCTYHLHSNKLQLREGRNANRWNQNRYKHTSHCTQNIYWADEGYFVKSHNSVLWIQDYNTESQYRAAIQEAHLSNKKPYQWPILGKTALKCLFCSSPHRVEQSTWRRWH